MPSSGCALTAEGARANPAGEQLYHDADVAFHRAVVRAAGNPVLGQMTEPIHRALAATFGALARPRMRFERGLPEHERILEAIRSGARPRRARGHARTSAHRRGLPARVRRLRVGDGVLAEAVLLTGQGTAMGP